MARASSKPHPFAEGNSSIGQTHLHFKRQFTSHHFRRILTIKRRLWIDSLSSSSATGGTGGSQDRIPEIQKPDSVEKKPPPAMIKVRFCVPFRCHSRQMLCMGGSQFPFGWSFVSIAKLPMTWNPNDLWTAEVYLPLGMRLEYKYVILEEQVWTNQQDEDSEGVMEVNYRTGTVPGQPPDVQKIRKQMAIVDWQPGPNRVVQVPFQDEIDRFITTGGNTPVQRKPERPRPYFTFRKLDSFTQKRSLTDTWEELRLDNENREPVLYRNDVWPYKSASFTFEDARRFFLGE
eukprot:g2175.t1